MDSSKMNILQIYYSIKIKASPRQLFTIISDFEGKAYQALFPMFEFSVPESSSFGKGSVYYSRIKGTNHWDKYQITHWEPGHRMSAKLISKNPLFLEFSFDHQLTSYSDYTLSKEFVYFSLGHTPFHHLSGLLIKPLIGFILRRAHEKLKKIAV